MFLSVILMADEPPCGLAQKEIYRCGCNSTQTTTLATTSLLAYDLYCGYALTHPRSYCGYDFANPRSFWQILPITDPYVVHHGALGGYATVYLSDTSETNKA